MLGIVRYGEDSAGTEELRLGGARFVCLTIGASRWPKGPLARRRADRGAAAMAEKGVRRALFPEEFPYKEIFAGRGIREVDPLPLARALGGRYICQRMGELGFLPGGTLAICGDSLRTEMREAVFYAVPRCRYVLLDVPRGGEDLAREVRRQWGAALQLRPAGDKLEAAEGLILYSPREDLSCRNPALCTAYPGGEAFPEPRLPEELAERMPQGYEPSRLAAALWYSGKLRSEDFFVEFIG